MTDENKPEEKQPAEAQTSFKWVRSPQGVFEAYANQGHITWSLDDVRLHFAQIGEIESPTPGEKFSPLNIEKAKITIPWRNAKILHLQLGQIIGNYEKANGEINLRPALASSEGT
jgi:hypothetical protein